jgi:hypothetical protein
MGGAARGVYTSGRTDSAVTILCLLIYYSYVKLIILSILSRNIFDFYLYGIKIVLL